MDYLNNGIVSTGVHVVLVHAFFLLDHVNGITKETIGYLGWKICKCPIFDGKNSSSVTPVLKESRIFNTYVITDTGYINHTMRKTT